MSKQTAIANINNLILQEREQGTSKKKHSSLDTIDALLEEERQQKEERRRQQQETLNATSAGEVMDLVRSYDNSTRERKLAETPQPVKEERRTGNIWQQAISEATPTATQPENSRQNQRRAYTSPTTERTKENRRLYGMDTTLPEGRYSQITIPETTTKRRTVADIYNDTATMTRWRELASKDQLTAAEKQEARAARKEIKSTLGFSPSDVEGQGWKTRYSSDELPMVEELFGIDTSLNNRTNSGAGIMAGVVHALGIDWLSDRIFDAAGIRGEDGSASPMKSTTTAIQKAQPGAYTVGNIAGSTGELLAISGAVGNAMKGVKWFTEAAPWIQKAISSGINFAINGLQSGITSTQTKEEWDEQERKNAALAAEFGVTYTPREYNPWKQVANVGISTGVGALAGAAGGALETVFGLGTSKALIRYGLQYNTIFRAIASGINGIGFATGSTAIQEASKYLQYPEGYTASPSEIASNLAVAFLFSSVSSVISDLKAAPQNRENLLKMMDELTREYAEVEMKMAGQTGQARRETAQRVTELTARIRNSVATSRGMSGVSNEIKNLVAALDIIDDRMAPIIAGGNGLLGTGDIMAQAEQAGIISALRLPAYNGESGGYDLAAVVQATGNNVPAPMGDAPAIPEAPAPAENFPAWYAAYQNAPRPIDQPMQQRPNIPAPSAATPPLPQQSAQGNAATPPAPPVPQNAAQRPTEQNNVPETPATLTPSENRGTMETANYTNAGRELADGLKAYDRLEKNGFEYTLNETSAGWIGRLHDIRGNRFGGMISNARALDYQTQALGSREEAIDTLVQVAERNNLLAEKAERNPPQQQNTPPIPGNGSESTNRSGLRMPETEEALTQAPAGGTMETEETPVIVKEDRPINKIFTPKLQQVLKRATRVRTFEYYGDNYITDGALSIAVGDRGKEHAQLNYRASDIDPKILEQYGFDKIAKSGILASEQPYVGTDKNGKKIYYFKTDKGILAFSKEYVDILDAGQRDPKSGSIRVDLVPLNKDQYPLLVSVGADGKIEGFLFGIHQRGHTISPYDLESLQRAKLKTVGGTVKPATPQVPEQKPTQPPAITSETTDRDIASQNGISHRLWSYSRGSEKPIYGIEIPSGKAYMGDAKAIVEVESTAESVALQDRKLGGVGASSQDMTNILKRAQEIIDTGETVTEQPKVLEQIKNAGKNEITYVFKMPDGTLKAIGRDQAGLITSSVGGFEGKLYYKPGDNLLVAVNDDGTIHGVARLNDAQVPQNILDEARSASLRGIKAAEKPLRISAADEVPSEAEAPLKIPTEQSEKPHEALAAAIRAELDAEKPITSQRLQELAEQAYGGTRGSGAYDIKTAYDAMELAVNQYLMNNAMIRDSANGDVYAAQRAVTYLEDLLSNLPTQTVRTEEQEQYQQFSTPPNIAYLAAWAANIGKGDTVLEPSAGIGGLALWPKAWGATVYGNELSPRRAEILRSLGLDEVFTENAEQINNVLPDRIKPTVVLMNPPFSSTAGRLSSNNTANAKRHIEQALDRLEDGGRLVAILGRGMSNDSKTFASWWDDLRKEYNIRANLSINGENYKKYGTTFDVQLVVIDKTGPQTGETITGKYDDLTEIPSALEGIRNDRIANDTGNPAAVGSVRHEGMESGADTGSHPDRGEGLRIGGGKTGDNSGQGVPEPPVRVGGRSAGSGNKGAVSGVSGGNGEAGVQGGTSGEEGRPASGSGAGKLELDRSDIKPEVDEAENTDSVYSAYVPRKARLKGSKPHPAKLVESAAMAAVEPPDVTYTPNLPKEIVTKGVLSDAQLENVIYAGQAHSQMNENGTRKGFFIGDGTGVGKGRQISGIIMDNFRQGRKKAIWISEKSALINDARRDWKALGGNEKDIISLGDKTNPKKVTAIKEPGGIMFGTYDTLKSDLNKRIKLLQDWLGKDFDGIIAFDEAHNMGNAVGEKGGWGSTGGGPSKKAIAGLELQKAFPNARVLYASATGATEASNYAYLERLGLWGPGTAFNNFNDFMTKISSGGLAAMELVARDMKAMGLYMARSISYDDVKYDTLTHDLTPVQTEIYNTMSKAWQKVLQNVERALELTGQNKNGMARGRALSAIYSTQQRFYDQIITSMSMPSVIADIRKELANGRSVVIQLTKTNAAAANRAIAKNTEAGGDLDDLDLTPSDSLIQMVEKSFPIELYEEYEDDNGNIRSRPVTDSNGNPVIDKKAVQMRDALIEDLKMMKVPDGPLEMLFDAFGEDQVAEVTGRTRRVVEKRMDDGSRKRVVESRSPSSGVADANAFQDGKKRILVFSDAGGTGRSYHADLTAKNQQQRVHYLLQPGWNASKAVQGFGRTHRSNQANAPIFRLVTTNVMGQKRFTSTIARRLDQLGALTKGQRQAGSGVFSEKDNLENPIAMDALSRYYRTLDPDILKKLGLYDKIYDSKGHFNENSEETRNIGKFLNRILSLEVDEQNRVFQGFYDMFDNFMQRAIENGTVDMGLENYRAEKIEVVDENVVKKHKSGGETKYVQLTAYQKPSIIPYEEIANKVGLRDMVRLEDGSVRAVYEISPKTNEKTGEIQNRYRLDSPVRGQSNNYLETTLKNKTTSIPKKEWSKAWKEEIKKVPEYTTENIHLLTGTLLPIWDKLPQGNARVMRITTANGKQYLGRVIRGDQIDGVLSSLGAKRTMKQYTGKQISEAVLKEGKEVAFQNDKLKLNRRRVGGEWRMELTGNNVWFIAKDNPDIISEKINYQNRYFIPTGEKGVAILNKIMESNPVMDVRKAAREGDDEVSNMVDSARKLYSTKHDFSKPVPADEFAKLIEEENNPENYFPKGLSKAFMQAIARKSTFTRPKLYRGIDSREFDFLAENKFLKSNSSYNFSDQQGQTLSDESARYALSYATGYAPKEIADLHYKDGLPTYLIEFINAPDLNVKKNNVQESYTYDVIDQDYITRIFEINYDPETGKDMVQDVTNSKAIKSMFPNLGKAISGMAHGVPALYRDKTTGTILYAVQGPDGYETGDYISEKDPSMMFNYDSMNDPTYSKHAPEMLGISGKESDLELWTPDESPQNFNGNNAPRHPENWKAERVGDKDKTPMSLTDIVNMIRHDFDIPVTTGNIRSRDARAQYRRQPQSVRSKIANSIPDIAHELGHHLDNIYDIRGNISQAAKQEIIDSMPESFKAAYKKEQLPGEGIAEFLRRYLQNSETAVMDYPKFSDELFKMLDSKARATLDKLADEVNAYYALSEQEGNWPVHNREDKGRDYRGLGEKLKDMNTHFRTLFIDSLEPIKQYDDESGGNAYLFATNAAYAGNRAYAAITGDLYDLRGNKLGVGLQKALEGIHLNNKKEYTDFGMYLICRHGPERLAEGMRVFADDAWDNTAWMEQTADELSEKYPAFEEAAERLEEYQHELIEAYGVASGLYSQETIDAWLERWEHYVPFLRWMGDKTGRTKGQKQGFANQTGPFRKARGSGLEIINPVDNIMENTVRLITASIRNEVMQKITEAASHMEGSGRWLEQVPMPLARKTWDGKGLKSKTLDEFNDFFKQAGVPFDPKLEDMFQKVLDNAIDDLLVQYGRGKAHGDIVTVMKNGSPQYWKINDPDLLRSVTTMGPTRAGELLNYYGRVTRFVTGNITGMNIVWSIASNMPRDIGTMFTFSKTKNIAKLLAGIGESYVNRIKGDKANELYKEFMAMGGNSTSAQTADKDMAKKARKALQKQKTDWLNPLEWVEFVSDMIEAGPRYSYYKICRTKYGMTPEEAFYAAMEITVNFKKAGVLSREVNILVPFFNAGIQGVDRAARWLAADDLPKEERKEGRTRRIGVYLGASLAIAALSMGLNLATKRKRDNLEKLSTYTKNNYFIVPTKNGKYVAIPKPRELAIPISLFERIMEYYIGHNPHALDDFWEYATDNTLPGVVSGLAQGDLNSAIGDLGVLGTFHYLTSNQDFLGRPIVSDSLAKMEPKDQYDQNTSQLAKLIGQAFNLSPKQMDFLGNNLFGGFWQWQKALAPVSGKSDLTLGVQSKWIKDPLYSTDITNRMYDQRDKLERLKNSNPDDMEIAAQYRTISDLSSFYGRYYRLAKNEEETPQNRMIREAMLDTILGVEQNAEVELARKFLLDVVEREGSTSLMPAVMDVTVTGDDKTTYNLTSEEYFMHQTRYEALYYNYIRQAMDNQPKMTDEEKTSTVEAAKKIAGIVARGEAVEDHGGTYKSYTKVKDLLEDGVSEGELINYLSAKDNADLDGNSKVSNAELLHATWKLKIPTDKAASLIDYSESNSNLGLKLRTVDDYGIDTNEYALVLDALGDLSVSQEHVQAAIDEVYGKTTAANKQEKAAMWQALGPTGKTAWKSSKNPYDTEVSEKVRSGLTIPKD